jgi:signal transduction histidine kinase
VFRSARLKLTLAYTLGIALIMATFSVALYVALAGNIDLPGSAGEHADQAIRAAQLSRIRLVLASVNAVGWLLAAGLSYLIAGRTLRPIEASLARQRQFTAHASHELRTPLTVIKGEVDLAFARERTAAQYQSTLHLIDAEVEHLGTLVDDLLELAGLEASERLPQREHREMGRPIREVVALLCARLSERQVRVVLDIPPNLEASLDWGRIRHLLTNLLENAVERTPVGGEIRISACAHDTSVSLSIFNSGPAIADTDLPHVFLPFYRGKGNNPEGGTGLGLALCDWIARAHGGSITVQNLADGVSFVVLLPST